MKTIKYLIIAIFRGGHLDRLQTKEEWKNGFME